VAGAASGFIHAGGQTLKQNRLDNKRYGSLNKYTVAARVGEGLSMPESSDAFKVAQRYRSKLDGGKTLSGAEIGRLVRANVEAQKVQTSERLQTAAEMRLTQLGESGDNAALAAAVVKQALGDELTRAEEKLIDSSKYGNRVANEITPENVKSGKYSSGWLEDMNSRSSETSDVGFVGADSGMSYDSAAAGALAQISTEGIQNAFDYYYGTDTDIPPSVVGISRDSDVYKGLEAAGLTRFVLRKKGQGGVRFEDGIGYRTPTEEELAVLRQELARTTEALMALPWYRRLIYRFLLGL
jgi:hypothetical protein